MASVFVVWACDGSGDRGDWGDVPARLEWSGHVTSLAFFEAAQ
jgi:hypothetical protein